MDLIDLQGLTAEERNIILNVIRRDEELRHRQDNRISELKQELHNLRMNGVLRSGDNLSKMCARCKNPFGFFVNTGENCPVCKFRVCKNCKENLLTQGWMCTLCFKENQLQWLTGDWMQKEEETNHKTEEFRNGTDLVRASLRVKHSNGNKIRSIDKGQDGQDNDHKLEEKTLSGHEDEGEGEEEEHDPCNDSAYSTAAHDAPEPQHISSNLNKSRQSDGDFTGASDQSDGGGASPMRPSSKASGGGGGTPKRSSNSHLSTPSVVATSHTGSIGEKSVDDDDNIDELFAKHLPGSRLGISRNSIGSSRESLASVYSDAGEINYGRIPVTGDITFSLVYDVKCSALRVHIKGCHDLAPVDTKHNRSDPYVKVYLLPDKTRSGKRKTKIKKHTLNPVFDETLSYHISQGELENRTLWVTVWHSDRFGRNDFLGEVTIPMDVHRFDDTAFCTYDLESRMPEEMNETAMQYKGELVVSLMYVTPDKVEDGKKSKSKSKKSKAAVDPRGEVHAMIKAANNLTAVRSNGGSDPFVKGYLLPDQRRTGKQKTPVVKNSVNPMWNQILVFDGIDPMELADRSLELTVWDHEKLGTNEFLGGVRLNLGQGVVKGGHQVDWMDARGEEAITWQSMMERPNTWIDAKLPLRASMGKSSTKK